jgi:hypothetical protein
MTDVLHPFKAKIPNVYLIGQTEREIVKGWLDHWALSVSATAESQGL